MIAGFPIPADAKPHEVAIIDAYARLRSSSLVARYLHYKNPGCVFRVVARYKVFLVKEASKSPEGESI